MFVQALAGFADTHLREQLDDVAFEQRPVPYLLQIGKDGAFLGILPRFTEVKTGGPGKRGGKAATAPKTKLQPEPMSVPRSPANRNAGLHPLLGADDLKYVLGPGAWTKDADIANHQERHDAFVALLRRVAQAIGDRALASCILFYDQPEQVQRAREQLAALNAAPGANIGLYIFGQPVTEREEVRAWWRQHYEASTAARSSADVAECLISGVVGPIPPTHPKIKGTAALGGQPAGVSLMSFDKPAFRSYGWEQNANSPVSADRAMAYVLALNHLLKPGSRHRKDFDGVAFLLWLKRDCGIEFESWLEEPPGDELLDHARAVLEQDRTAFLSQKESNELYMASMSATGSRLVLRSWSTLPLQEAVTNLTGFWEGLKMQPFDPTQPARAEPFWKLLYALDREGKPPASRTVALRLRALEGPAKPLGYRMVGEVLARMRVDRAKRTDLAALGLLRLCVNDQHAFDGEEMMPSGLNVNDSRYSHPAYVCGRLLAVHDNLQWRTFDTAGESQPNATVADRYYTLMMNSPFISWAKVAELGRKHMTKLRKHDEKNGTAYSYSLSARIRELTEQLGADIPPVFDLHDKARFALGFYHEKSLRLRPRNTEQAQSTDTESTSTSEEIQ
jgi:CRISPR-associated protein Csd1